MFYRCVISPIKIHANPFGDDAEGIIHYTAYCIWPMSVSGHVRKVAHCLLRMGWGYYCGVVIPKQYGYASLPRNSVDANRRKAAVSSAPSCCMA